MHRTVRAFVLFAFVLAGCQSEPSVPVAEIVSSGVYRITRADAAAADAGGGRVVAAKLELERAADSVPAVLNGNFGFEFTVSGLPTRKSLAIELKARHPAVVGPDGVSRTEVVSTLPVYTASGAYRNAFVYQFDRPEDLQPGRWTLQVLYGDRVLVERSYEVTPAR